MSFGRAAALALLSLLLALPAGLAPPAAAHCPSPGGSIFGLVSTCGHNDEVESVLVPANNATSASVVTIVVKDKSFHPPVVTIKSGATVVFLYADLDQSLQHDPRGSGRCTTLVDPVAVPEDCVPSTSTWICFDQATDDNQNAMQATGQTYPLTLKYASPAGPVQKSRGFLSGSAVGDATGAQEFRTCPLTTGYYAGAQAVIPYHCGLHGHALSVEKMRGTIIVQA